MIPDRPTTTDADTISVLHDATYWLGGYLAQLADEGKPAPDGADELYKHLLRCEARHAAEMMHEHGRREDGESGRPGPPILSGPPIRERRQATGPRPRIRPVR